MDILSSPRIENASISMPLTVIEMNVEELIAMGELEAAREVLRNIDRRKLNNGELSDYTRNVINLGLAFRENGKLDDGVNTIVALLDDLESISWGL